MYTWIFIRLYSLYLIKDNSINIMQTYMYSFCRRRMGTSHPDLYRGHTPPPFGRGYTPPLPSGGRGLTPPPLTLGGRGVTPPLLGSDMMTTSQYQRTDYR